MKLGDARSGKLPENIIGFGRALRRAGVPIDSQRMALAIEAAGLVGVERKEDLHAALGSVLVNRQQDMEVFDQLFLALFRNPELAQQLLAQMLPKVRQGQPPSRKARVQEALAATKKTEGGPRQESEIQLDAAMTASDRQRLQHADFATLNASEFRLIERLVRDIPLSLAPVPALSNACCNLASTVAEVPKTPVCTTARNPRWLATDTQPVLSAPAAWEAGSMVARTASISLAFELGNIVFLLVWQAL